MKQLISAQELARKNNENAAVYATYRRKHKLRRQLGRKSKLPAKVLDDLDWQAAEREARPVRAVASCPRKPERGRLDALPDAGFNLLQQAAVAEHLELHWLAVVPT